MPESISTEDLYGPSSESAQVPQSAPPIPVEETPEIPMSTMPSASVPPPPPPPKASFGVGAAVLLIFAGLFGVGVWLSSFFRQYIPGFSSPQTAQVVSTTPAPVAVVPKDPVSTWKTYNVISGATKLPVGGIAFKMPSEILSPICDSTNCVSQGTYLPGGTRFTVAARGAGQLLADFRGRVVSDVGGIVFTTKDASVSGHKAQEFTGVFTGQTVSGYAFSRMRGFMVEVTPTLSLEINHFTPNGITADFTKDDALFDQIVKTVSFTTAASTLAPTISVAPIATATPKPATSSGY